MMKYRVLVGARISAWTWLEVEAETRESAFELAKESAGDLASSVWTLDDDDHAVEIGGVMDVEDEDPRHDDGSPCDDPCHGPTWTARERLGALRHALNTGADLAGALARYEATGDHNHGRGPIAPGGPCGEGDDCLVRRARERLTGSAA